MKRIVNLLKHLLTQAAIMGCALATISLAWFVDTSRPVIKEFKVTGQQNTDLGIVVEGSMVKQRDCKLEEVAAYTEEGRKVHVNFLDVPPNTPPSSRVARFQLWGPWEIFSGQSNSVALYSRHSCHLFWSQTTKLVDLAVVRVTHENQ